MLNNNYETIFPQTDRLYIQLTKLMVMNDHDHVKQEQELWEANPIDTADGEEDIDIAAIVVVLVLVPVQHAHDHDHDHDHEQAAVKEALPVAEQDVQEGFDIVEEEQIQFHVQGAVQSDDGWGYFESAGYVLSVEPEPDAIQRYLEGSGP